MGDGNSLGTIQTGGLSLRDRVRILLGSGVSAMARVAMLVFVAAVGLSLVSVPAAALTEADHDTDVYYWPYPVLALGVSTTVWGTYAEPSSIWYTRGEHWAEAIIWCWFCASLVSNSIEFYSDQYDYWYSLQAAMGTFNKKPMMPGFEGLGTYDRGVFLLLGIQIVKECTSTVMRIPQ